MFDWQTEFSRRIHKLFPRIIFRCYNMPGTYRCVCIEGYEGTGDKDGGDCVNIDECARGMHDCHLNSEVRRF